MSAEIFFKRGIEKMNQADYSGAVDEFSRALQIQPNNSRVYYLRGLARYQMPVPADRLLRAMGAIEDFSQAIELEPSFEWAYRFRGEIRSKVLMLKQAIEDYNQAIRINPNFAEVYYLRGKAYATYAAIDYRTAAFEDYTKVIELSANLDDAYFLADAYFGRAEVRGFGDREGRLADYTKGIELNPGNAKAYAERAFYRNREDINGAIADYTQAIQIDPNNEDFYFMRGIKFRDLGEKQAAIRDIQKSADICLQHIKMDEYEGRLNLIKEIQQ